MAEKSQPKGFDLDEKLVRRLADLLHDSDISEIEYENEGRRIRVSRNVTVTASAPAPAPPAAAPAGADKPAGGHGNDAPPPGAVTSPMVATVYVAGEPGSPPFVKVGDKVQKGDTLLILEAMKVMNPLTAPHGGTVTQILVSDSQPVEYGEPLLVIE